MGDLSAHFSTHEFACHHCGKVRVHRELVDRLELLRSIVGAPIRIVDGYRCPVHNRAVGGARRSQHLLGRAVDLHLGAVELDEAKRAGFRGIGRNGQWAVHVDVRTGARAVFVDV